ncbi:MAG TPA: glycosyltransferase, partial [Chloroflexia bacterium]|nr:glycosyltransferase [Chloroflexia bacterium]
MPRTVPARPPAWLLIYTAGLLGGTARIIHLLTQEPERPRLRYAVQSPGGPPPSPPPAGMAEWPFVSVIVPARDEARNLPKLLPSLLDQSYPPDRFEVIVVDDQSTDASPEILADFAGRYPQLRVVQGTPLPAGWKGKPWAMHQGEQVARGEWLLFTDADTVHHPAGIASSVADAVEREVDLYTIAPCPVLSGPAERLIMPVVFLGIFTFFHPSFVNDPRSPIAIANGQYILIRRGVY